MPIRYPKFDKKISDQIDNSKFQQSKTRTGTIMNYNSMDNTATVMVDEKFSNNIRKYDHKRSLSICLWSSNSGSSAWH